MNKNHQPQPVHIPTPLEYLKCKCGSELFQTIFKTFRAPLTYQPMLNGAKHIDQHMIVCVKCGTLQNLNSDTEDKKDKKNMTLRQEGLKKEIIAISDYLQLGIRESDHDWFYLFMQRMSVSEQRDSITSVNGWSMVSNSSRISRNFIDEFSNKLSMGLVFLNNQDKFSIEELFERVNSVYLCGFDYYIALDLAKKNTLTDELVVKYEKVFDQTHGRCGSNAVPYNKETAWYYIMNNPNISQEIKDKFSKKPLKNKNC